MEDLIIFKRREGTEHGTINCCHRFRRVSDSQVVLDIFCEQESNESYNIYNLDELKFYINEKDLKEYKNKIIDWYNQ